LDPDVALDEVNVTSDVVEFLVLLPLTLFVLLEEED
jgi:hypothetical protein